jgi:hypothetical protein
MPHASLNTVPHSDGEVIARDMRDELPACTDAPLVVLACTDPLEGRFEELLLQTPCCPVDGSMPSISSAKVYVQAAPAAGCPADDATSSLAPYPRSPCTAHQRGFDALCLPMLA